MTDERTVYAYYPVFRRKDRSDAFDVEAATNEWSKALEERPDVRVRGVYSAGGFRPDTDLMLWLVAQSADELQDALLALHRTELGMRLELTHAFMGTVRPPEFNPQHVPAFVRGAPPGRYLCVYPFVRTAEWYLQPAERRAELLREHGEIGREYPDVLPNTTSAFGLGDWEWILAFEADELHRLVDCIRRLRDSDSRRFVKEETPFVVGIRKDLADVIQDLA